MNKDSDDGFIYCNDDMQTVSQRPDRTELRPNSIPSKSVSYIFNYEAFSSLQLPLPFTAYMLFRLVYITATPFLSALTLPKYTVSSSFKIHLRGPSPERPGITTSLLFLNNFTG